MNLFGRDSSGRDDSFRPGDPADPAPQGPSTARITIWIVVGAIGLYMIVSGVIGGLSAGA
ncbi:hypothetical protein [Microbacterium sp. T2.11-28]|uniref:hypothetical protein n=1 Tax=Microbacterium sp. T2.11-28 TaxID=3041169 RepID=UPI0024777E96|nr:hypothetical protein [Microbacterium sp. T2.11-28]CAI9386913.1 hypothetical protein MICABA_00668 [Microbacterium sp. T2.11-28]